MQLLVIGHPLVIDANRKFWNVYARLTGSTVDALVPKTWSSNLKKHIPYQYNPQTDGHFRRIVPCPAYVQGNGSFFFFHPWVLWRTLCRQRYDAIYVNQETWALVTLVILLAKLFSPNRRTPLSLYVQQNLKKHKLRFLHPYERLVARFVTTFLYCSEGVKDVLRWKGIRTHCHYFALPFDEESYRPLPFSPQRSPFRLGYLGRISEDKGMAVLVAAVEELRAQGDEIELVVGGNGPLVDELTRHPFVRYLGLIPHSQAHTFYETIDCFVLPSQTRPHWKEQFGRVIVESLAAGRPVIGSSSGSIPEVLSRAGWNWVFQEDSPAELARKIRELRQRLSTPAGEAELARAVEQNFRLFSMESVARDIHQEFQRQVGGS